MTSDQRRGVECAAAGAARGRRARQSMPFAVLMALSGVLSLAARADEPIPAAQADALLVRYNCASCHASYTTLHGPSLQAIARKYSPDPTAQEELEAMVVNGSTGVWGTESAMPPNEVPQEAVHTLVEWILSFR